MPLYEYQCGACSTTFTLIRDLDCRHDPAACTACDEPDARRILSGFSVRVGAARGPQSLAQQLAGPGVVASSQAQANSVLGSGCSH
jgi:putative FmdB family regulatory protein